MSARSKLLALHDDIMFRRADGQCECEGQCGTKAHRVGYATRCTNKHGRPATQGTDRSVSLTVKPIDGDERNTAESNLIALCQDCVKRHRAKLKAKADKAQAAVDAGGLFDVSLEVAPTGLTL